MGNRWTKYTLYQLFDLIEEFYLTRIYGNYNCDTKIGA